MSAQGPDLFYVGWGSSDGRLALTSMVTSSNVMVKSILSKLLVGSFDKLSLLGYLELLRVQKQQGDCH